MSMGLFASIRRHLRRKQILKQVRQLQSMTVGQIMTRYVITVRPEDDVIKAATKMIAEDISCLVVAVEDKPVGVLSERDFLRKVPLSKDVFKMKVKDIMTPNPVTIKSDMQLPDAVALMKQNHFRRLIVAEEGKLLGIVTQTDFTKTINKIFVEYPIVPELMMGAIMTKDVLAVTPKNTVAQAKQKMLKANVGAILILDNEKTKTPLGIFTEYDVVMQFYDQHGKLEMKTIDAYMRKHVRAVEPQASIFGSNHLMLEKNMRRLLIVKDRQILGIVTQTDICRFVYTNLDMIEKAVQRKDAVLKLTESIPETRGEFHGEHLKVYSVD